MSKTLHTGIPVKLSGSRSMKGIVTCTVEHGPEKGKVKVRWNSGRVGLCRPDDLEVQKPILETI